MGIFVSLIGILLIILSGCTDNQNLTPSPKNHIKTASQQIKAFEDLGVKKTPPPALVLPPIYHKLSIFDNKTITFSAKNASLANVLYSISKISGVNLVIDKDVDTKTPITLSVHDANLKDVLNIVSNMSGCYYVIKGNILHVKEYMRKFFLIPYVHTTSSSDTKLGGNMLSSVNSSGGSSSGGGSSSSSGSGGIGVKGAYRLNFTNSKKENNFYDDLQNNIKALLSKHGSYTLNRFSGVLSVYDKRKNILAVSRMIGDVLKQADKQVLIEAKILEVTLNHSHQLGVNWNLVGKDILKAGDSFTLNQTLGLPGTTAGSASYNSNSFQAVINALNQAGKIDTVSNPRITVLSGQSAIISSGKLVPFFSKYIQFTQGTSLSNSQITYTQSNILNGVTMGVTPTVMKNGKIMLNIIPITSTIVSVKKQYDNNGVVVASAPVIDIKELGTTIYANNNSLVFIGGLISNSISKQKQSVPFLDKLPFVGSLFTQTIDTTEKKELVILLRLRVIK